MCWKLPFFPCKLKLFLRVANMFWVKLSTTYSFLLENIDWNRSQHTHSHTTYARTHTHSHTHTHKRRHFWTTYINLISKFAVDKFCPTEKSRILILKLMFYGYCRNATSYVIFWQDKWNFANLQNHLIFFTNLNCTIFLNIFKESLIIICKSIFLKLLSLKKCMVPKINLKAFIQHK